MSVFEHSWILAQLKAFKVGKKAQANFKDKWKASVSCCPWPIEADNYLPSTLCPPQIKKRISKWDNQTNCEDQLEFTANVIEYVSYLAKATSARAGSKAANDPIPLRKELPLLGPGFVPPSYSDLQWRDPFWNIEPTSSYVKVVHILHPVFYSSLLDRCPQCNSKETSWQQWTTSGTHHVHGLRHDEMVIGIQLQCKLCKEQYGGKKDRKSVV